MPLKRERGQIIFSELPPRKSKPWLKPNTSACRRKARTSPSSIGIEKSLPRSYEAQLRNIKGERETVRLLAVMEGVDFFNLNFAVPFASYRKSHMKSGKKYSPRLFYLALILAGAFLSFAPVGWRAFGADSPDDNPPVSPEVSTLATAAIRPHGLIVPLRRPSQGQCCTADAQHVRR